MVKNVVNGVSLSNFKSMLKNRKYYAQIKSSGLFDSEFYSETYDETLQRYVIRRACNPCNTRTTPVCDR